MKLAIIGSRSLEITDLQKYIPENTTEIISGGAKGIDSCARSFAMKHKIKYTEFLPEYEKYGKAAPLIRNRQIVQFCDEVLAFWDGKSKGTKSVIDYCNKNNIKIRIISIIDADKQKEL